MPALPSALGEIGRITAILGDQPAIFLDYDGTLTPIVSDPNNARIGDADRFVLTTLARQVPVAIISGRNLDDLQHLVGVEGLIYSVNHGWEIGVPESTPSDTHREARCSGSSVRLISYSRRALVASPESP